MLAAGQNLLPPISARNGSLLASGALSGNGCSSMSSMSIPSAIAQGPRDLRDRNNAFVNSDRRHVLLLNPQGYAGPTFPFSAKDTGGQVDYVNYEARTLAEMGYKVTVATRSFKPLPQYQQYGDRRGVQFMEGTNDRVRYVYVPGILGSDAEFLPKETIYADLERMAINLWQFLSGEAALRGLKPWEVSAITYINSHYVDGGMMGAFIVRYWQSQRAAEFIREHFLPALGNATFQPESFLENMNANLGMAVISAYRDAHAHGALQLLSGMTNRAEVLQWAAQKLGWAEARSQRLLHGLPKSCGKEESFAQDAMDASSIGRRLMLEEKRIRKGLRQELRALNRNLWTPHSIGWLKEWREIQTGVAESNPENHLKMNFGIRKIFEGMLLRKKYNPLAHLPPPVRAAVETSLEIGEAMFMEGRTDKNRFLKFLPGIDPTKYFVRASIDREGIPEMFEDLRGRGVIPAEVIEALQAHPDRFNIILEASRMEDTKRKVCVVDAFALLPKHLREQTMLFITGERDEQTKEVYDQVRGRIDDLGVGDRVFLVGMVPDEHIGAFGSLPHGRGARTFRHVQFVCASRMEGWGMAAQNSAYAGIPLIASVHTPVGGYLRYKDSAAFVVQQDTAKGFSEVMRKLILHPEDAAQMGQRSGEILKDHTWEVLTRRFDERAVDILHLGGVSVHPDSERGRRSSDRP